MLASRVLALHVLALSLSWACPAGAATVTFQGRHGIAAAAPFDWRMDQDHVRVVPDDHPPFAGARGDAGLDDLRRAGFDFVRLVVDPAPLIDAGPHDRRQLSILLRQAIHDIRRHGLRVVLDLHPPALRQPWTARVLANPDGDDIGPAYVVAALDAARLIGDQPPDAVALELFNEPPCDTWNGSTWPQRAAHLAARVRRVLPHHTLIVSGACNAGIDGLTDLDPAAFDANTLFTFHYYEPYLFTHQGYWNADGSPPYINQLAWPAQRMDLPATVSRALAAVASDGKRSLAERAQVSAAIVQDLYHYATRDYGPQTQAQALARVMAWAELHSLPPNRILMGEFGVERDIYGYSGALPDDRLRYLASLRAAAEARGLRWSLWSLTGPMGILQQGNSGPLDPAMLRALGLRTGVAVRKSSRARG